MLYSGSTHTMIQMPNIDQNGAHCQLLLQGMARPHDLTLVCKYNGNQGKMINSQVLYDVLGRFYQLYQVALTPS